MKRVSKYIVKSLLILVLLAGMAAMAGISWLKSEPRVLPGITQNLTRIIEMQGWPVKVSFGRVATRWEEWRTPLMVQIEDLSVESNDGKVSLTVPRSVVAFRMLPLLRGRIIFKHIALDSPKIVVHLEEETAVPLPAPAAAETPGWLDDWHNAFAAPGYRMALEKIFRIVEKPSRLPIRAVSAKNLELELHTTSGPRVYQQEAFLFKLVRNREGNEIRLALKRAGSSLEFQLMEDTEKTLWAKLTFDNFSTDWLKDIDQDYNWYANLGLYFDGELSGLLRRDGLIESATLGLASNELSSLPFSLSADIKNEGDMGENRNVPSVQLRIDLRGMPVDKIAGYWPLDAAVDARDWVTQNLSKGTVNSATAEISLPPESFINGVLPVDGVKAEVRFEETDALYMEGMPPLTQLRGTAFFTRDTMRVEVAEGRLKESKLSKGTLYIPNLGGVEVERMDIEGETEGPAKNLAMFYDVQQQKLGKKPEFDGQKLEGNAKTKFSVHLPLLLDLPFAEVKYAVEGTLSGLSHPQIAKGIAMTDGDLKLSIKDNVNAITGSATLNGAPADLEYITDAREKREYNSSLAVVSRATLKEFSTLGFPQVEGIDGPVLLDYKQRDLTNGLTVATSQLTLDEASISMADFGVTKPAGEPLVLKLGLEGKGTPVLKSIEATGKTINAKGTASMTPQSELKELVFDNLRVGETIGKVRVNHDGGIYNVLLNMEKIDARPFLADTGKKPEKPDEKKDGPSYSVKGRSKQILMAGGEIFYDVSGEMACNPIECTRAKLDAKTGDRKGFALSITPGKTEKLFTASASNAGAVMRGLDVIGDMQGGILSARAVADATKPGAAYVGSVIIKDFRIVKAPVLAKLLSVASFTGIIDALNGKGVGFNKLDGRGSYQKDTWQIESMKMSGSAIGILASGYVDTNASEMKMNGTLIPAYALNSAIGQVPLLGNILGKGVLATSFSISGPLADPKTEVYPLSTIAPGIVSDFMREIGILPSGKTPRPQPKKN